MKGQTKVVSAMAAPSTEGLTYAAPSEVGLDSAYIHHRVDSIMTNAIKLQAFPGAQVLVAKNGKIIFHKAYGHHSYDSIQPSALDDLYDLASVTKIAASMPALMTLVETHKLNLDRPLSIYWKRWKGKK
ncbi:MAG: serine hydrolase domain-containing protein, partial [Flavobacteriaceae bacterium]